MVKRTVKRRVKRTFLLIASAILALIAIVFIFLGLKTILPAINKSNQATTDKIIRPVGRTTELSDLKRMIDKQNIIFDTLKETSISGLIIGEMREGPKVYFSKNQDAYWQVSSLQLILARLTIDNKKPKLIDLRQARPIVKL